MVEVLIEINAADTNLHLLGSNKGLKGQKGINMVVGEGLVNGHMGAAGRVLRREGGTCGVPCSPVTLILSGDLTKRRTSCHSHRSFDVLLRNSHTHTHPTSEESRLVFVHNEDWWLCWWANWQTPQTEKRKKKGGKIKQDSYSSLRICGARAVQFSCLEPEAWQKRGPSWELTQDILLIKQPGRPHRDTDTDKRGNTVNSSETSSQMHLPLMSLMSSSENCAPKTESL